ncbi:MAG: hypothetical protein ACM3IJ_04550 [Candidatus Levyibacteriota bacterium]
MDTELTAWGDPPGVGTPAQRAYRLENFSRSRHGWNRIGHDIPELVPPGAPAPAPRRQVDYGPLGWIAGALLIAAGAAVLFFALILPLSKWGWDQSFGDDTAVQQPGNQPGNQPGGNNGNGSGNANQPGNNGNGSGNANQPGNQPGNSGVIKNLADGQFPWTPPTPGTDLGNDKQFTSTIIEQAKQGDWIHRLFNPGLFNAANNYGGADSWAISLNVGPNAGGSWKGEGVSGRFVYRAVQNQVGWCLGILTSKTWNNIDLKSQLLSGSDPSLPIGFNVRIEPGSTVMVKTNSGEIKSGVTSDMGDIQVVLPDSGLTTICTAFSTAAPTGESQLWVGPRDRSKDINTIDAR